MTFLEILPIALTVLIIGGAVFDLVRQKKKGTKCIGCPYGKSCPGACNGACPSDPEKENNSLHK